MNLDQGSQPVRKDYPRVNLIWRFYSDPAHLWRWQRLAFDGAVVEHSKSGHTRYEGCLADAREQGYVFLPSLTTKPERKASKARRSYIRLTTNHQKLVSETATEDVEQKEDIPMDDALLEDSLIGDEAL